MSDDGIRNINALETGKARAEVEIAIFINAEEVLIEKTDAVEHRSAQKNTAAGRAEDFCRFQENPVGFAAVSAFVRHAGDRHPVSGAVESARSENHTRSGEADAVIFC